MRPASRPYPHMRWISRIVDPRRDSQGVATCPRPASQSSRRHLGRHRDSSAHSGGVRELPSRCWSRCSGGCRASDEPSIVDVYGNLAMLDGAARSGQSNPSWLGRWGNSCRSALPAVPGAGGHPSLELVVGHSIAEPKEGRRGEVDAVVLAVGHVVAGGRDHRGWGPAGRGCGRSRSSGDGGRGGGCCSEATVDLRGIVVRGRAGGGCSGRPVRRGRTDRGVGPQSARVGHRRVRRHASRLGAGHGQPGQPSR